MNGTNSSNKAAQAEIERLVSLAQAQKQERDKKGNGCRVHLYPVGKST